MSFIYDARCSECGSAIEITGAEIDDGQDITIRVKPCSDCIESALKEKEEEYQARMDESRT